MLSPEGSLIVPLIGWQINPASKTLTFTFAANPREGRCLPATSPAQQPPPPGTARGGFRGWRKIWFIRPGFRLVIARYFCGRFQIKFDFGIRFDFNRLIRFSNSCLRLTRDADKDECLVLKVYT